MASKDCVVCGKDMTTKMPTGHYLCSDCESEGRRVDRMNGVFDELREYREEKKEALKREIRDEMGVLYEKLGEVFSEISRWNHRRFDLKNKVTRKFSVLKLLLEDKEDTLLCKTDVLVNNRLSYLGNVQQEYKSLLENLKETYKALEIGSGRNLFPRLPECSVENVHQEYDLTLVMNFPQAESFIRAIGAIGSSQPAPFSCPHYKNLNCWSVATCCRTHYSCKQCHNSTESHSLQKFSKTICGFCYFLQEFKNSTECKGCKKRLKSH